MLFLRGAAAITPFKLEQQLKTIQQQVPALQGLQMSWLYLVEHCGVSHPSTFPAVSPLYRLDGLLTAAGGAVTVDVSANDMALSAIGSWDPETGEQASDHMPVVGTLRLIE